MGNSPAQAPQKHHKNHAIHHVFTTFLWSKRSRFSLADAKETGMKSEENPRITVKLATTHHKARGFFLSTGKWLDLFCCLSA
jgi:hypothetical protein